MALSVRIIDPDTVVLRMAPFNGNLVMETMTRPFYPSRRTLDRSKISTRPGKIPILSLTSFMYAPFNNNRR